MTPAPLSLPEQAMRTLLRDRYGLDEARLQTDWLDRLLRRAASARGEELDAALAAAVTINESSFLRHPHHFEWLVERWLPRAIERRAQRRELRVLSAPCAAGEEAFSLTARLREALPAGWKLTVLGVDISPDCLQVAALGRYPLWSLRGVDVEREATWLHVHGAHVQVDAAVQAETHFLRHNLMDPLPEAGTWDLIFCRNALIYFHREAVERAYLHLASGLAPGGVLVPGPADPKPPEACGLLSHWEDDVRVLTVGPPRSGRVATPTADARRAEPQAAVAAPASPPPGRTTARIARSTRPRPLDHIARARELAGQGALDDASTMLRELAEEAPLDPRPQLLLALVEGDRGDRQAAMRAARHAAFLAPEAPFAHFLLADAFEQSGLPRQAAPRYRAALDLLATLPPETTLEGAEGLTAGQLVVVIAPRLRATEGGAVA